MVVKGIRQKLLWIRPIWNMASLMGMGFTSRKKPSIKSRSVSYTHLDVYKRQVKGPEGNIEYLIYLEKAQEPCQAGGVLDAWDLVEASHQALDRPGAK